MTINTKSKLATTSFYIFGNPRYNVATADGKYVPDKRERDYLNGTYDFYFPMMKITESSPPTISWTSITDNYILSGAASPFPLNQNIYSIGEIDRPDKPKNTSLEKLEITETLYGYLPINPGWDVLQDNFLVKLTGNYTVTKNLHSLKLESAPLSTIYRGTYVEYQDKLYLCMNNTLTAPSPNNSTWLEVKKDTNVFNADVYLFSFLSIPNTVYSYHVTDPVRYFNPDEYSDLVSWNCAYYVS